MQKFDDIIENNVKFVLDKTIEISKILENENLSTQDFDDLSDIYSVRDGLINQLKIDVESEQGKIYLVDNSQFWTEIMQKILDCDKQNVELLKIKTDQASEKVRNIHKQKSVLIYNR